MNIKKIVQWILCLSFMSVLALAATKESKPARKTNAILTCQKVARFLVKESGQFKRYVPAKADDKWCVDFLSKLGVQLYLKGESNQTGFSKKDMARVLGQIELLLNGEATYLNGGIQLPENIKSWVEFCTLNKVEYRMPYKAMRNDFVKGLK